MVMYAYAFFYLNLNKNEKGVFDSLLSICKLDFF